MKLVGTVKEMIESNIISASSVLAFYPDALVEIMPSERALENFMEKFNAPLSKRNEAMSNIAFALDLENPKRDTTGMLYSVGTIIPQEFLSKEHFQPEFDPDKILAEILAGCGERECEDEAYKPIFIIAMR